MPTQEATTEYHLREHTALRNEIDELVREARTLERWALVAAGGVVVWLYSNHDVSLPAGAYWVPFLLAAACAIRVFHYQINLRHAVAYSKKIEEHFCTVDAVEGWNHFVDGARRNKYSIPSVIFWGLFIVLTALFAVIH